MVFWMTLALVLAPALPLPDYLPEVRSGAPTEYTVNR
jgi:hypothetical protein